MSHSSFAICHFLFAISHLLSAICYMPPAIRYQPLGDSALNIQFGDQIDPDINQRVHAFVETIQRELLDGIVECVPTYCALLIHYDPLQLTYQELVNYLNITTFTHHSSRITPPRLIEIPTHYDGEDLDFVAQHNHLSIEDVIRIHSQTEFHVYMMGFTPGFAYMGKLDSRIVTPRLDSPRKLVKAGSVGIAGEQTGIYPIDSPGGWRLIGRTAVKLFDLDHDPPFLLAPNDRVKFVNVGE